MTGNPADPEDPHLREVLDEVNHGELGWAIVRVHVRVEGELWRLARERLPRPQLLPERSGWAALLRWVAAAGLVGEELFVPLVKLNKLRNEVAHRIGGGVSPEQMADLVKACPAYYHAHRFENQEGSFRAAIGQLYLSVRNTRTV